MTISTSVKAFILCLACGTTTTVARERPFIDEPETHRSLPETTAQQDRDAETTVVLPAYPQAEDLVEFVSNVSVSNLRYFIDHKSLRINTTTSTVYYTLVVLSTSGVQNVSFEGMRCDTREYQVYAVNNMAGHWQPLPKSKWTRIKQSGQYKHHMDLRELYFCQAELGYSPHTLKAILHNLGIN